jgi:hypothetical protein
LWNDYNYGFYDLTGLLVWVDAAAAAENSGAQYLLSDYFRLSNAQMSQILVKVRRGIGTKFIYILK